MLAEDYLRLDKKYNISIYNEELPMCVIMSGYNNNNNFRIEYALNSVFLQNYSNYHAIIIDDFSNDGSQEIYRRYFDFYDIEESIAKLILNEKRKTSL